MNKNDIKIEIVPSSAFPGMVDLTVAENGKQLVILCNTVEDAFKTIERDGEVISFLLK